MPEPRVDFTDLAFDLIAPKDVHEALGLVLSRIGNRLQAEQVLLALFDKNQSQLDSKAQWLTESSEQLFETVTVSEIPWIIDQMWQSNTVSLLDLSTAVIPNQDQTWLSSRKVSSLLVIPVPLDRALGGILWIHNPKAAFLEDEEAIGQLRALAAALGKVWQQESLSKTKSRNSSQTLFEQVFDSIEDGLILVSAQHQILAINQKALDLVNLTAQELEHQPLIVLEKVLPQGGMALIQRDLGYMKMGIQNQPEEFEITNKDGEQTVIEIDSVAIQDSDKDAGSVIILRDITFRKGMEQSAQESETKLRRVLEAIKEGITLSDDSGYFEIFNPEMELLTGYSRQEANQNPHFIDDIHFDQDSQTARARLADVHEGEKKSVEVDLQAKDGSRKRLSVSTTVLNAEGKRYFLSAYHDETARKQAEDQLRARNEALQLTTDELHQTTEQLRDARDHLEEKVAEKTQALQEKVVEVENLARFPSEDPFPVMRIQFDGQLLYANSASQALLDRWNCSIGQIVPEGWSRLVEEVSQTNNRKYFEVEILGQYISFVLVPVKSGNYVNLYGRDVSHEKEVEEMKNQFISMVSHQIRTPITSVRWYSEMLLRGKKDNALTPKQKELTATIHNTAVNLTELVNDLLSISRMESGKLDYKGEPADITSLIQEVIHELAPQAKKNSIEVKFDTPQIDLFKFDPKLIKEVYRNLLSNAIKYTQTNGQVTIQLILSEEVLETRVSDSGIGIPKAAQADIFKRFYRAQNAVDSDLEGTGLGLSVVKLIVEKAGGNIWFDSEENQGTTFYFTLPLQSML